MLPTGRSRLTTDLIKGIVAVVLCFYAATHIPIVGFFVSLLIPLIVLFHRLRLGQKNGVVVPVVSAAVMAAVLGAASFEMLFFFELMVLGFALGELFEKNLSIEKTLFLACAVVMVSGFLCMVVYSGFAGVAPTTMIREYVDRNLQMTLSLYQDIGIPEDVLKTVSDSLDMIRDYLIRLMPAVIASSVLFAAWATLVMARPIARRFALPVPEFGRLNRWKAPEMLVWGVIGSGIVLLFPGGIFRIVSVNVLIVMMTIYFFSGIAIVSFFLEKRRFPLIVRACIYSFIALQQILFFLVIGIGFFDTWLNFRKLEFQKK